MTARVLAALTLLVGVLALLPAHAQATRPNVLVVLVDAMRADRLGPYGYTRRPTTPNLDRFAKRSVVFENTLSQAGWTVPAVASLFTSKDPQAHRVLRYNKDQRLESDELAASHETMAERFQAAGYQTVALKKSVVLDTNRGMNQGFDLSQVVPGDMAEGRSAEQLTDAALAWITTERDPSRPFFLYLHYMDTHSSYRPPEPFYSQWKGGYTGALTGDHMEIERRFVQAKEKPTQADLDYLNALYDAEVAYWDVHFGRLMQGLVLAGLDPNTVVVLTADHGEAFYEHGQFFHGHVWLENLRIPFVVRAPGVAPGRRSHWTQLVDVAPTVAELAGLGVSPQWTGRSQAGTLRGGAPTVASVYGEYGNLKTLISPEQMKLLVGEGAARLYNLAADPGEKNDLAPVRGLLLDRLKADLEARVAAAKKEGGALPAVVPQALTPEQIEALRQLGYVD